MMEIQMMETVEILPEKLKMDMLVQEELTLKKILENSE